MFSMIQVCTDTLACTYAALILVDDGLPVDAASMTKLIKEAHVEVESFWPGMFARALGGENVTELMCKIGSGEML
jgi:large subunit ribosomal protein LP1